jgi:hypothetical protein
MNRRNHTAPVTCLLAVVLFIVFESAALAQAFMPPPPTFPGRPSLVAGRFYFTGGAQYRNIQRFGFERKTSPIIYQFEPGVPPFGPNEAGEFGTGTGRIGYPTNPTGNPADLPAVSGIWNYLNGLIDPTGSTTIWPNSPFSGSPTLLGLGQYATSAGTPTQVGSFTVAAPNKQVGTSGTLVGFSLTDPPPFNESYTITWERLLDDTVVAEGGVESIIYRYDTQEINTEFSEGIWTPALELGFQWTNFFDIFGAFSWYDISDKVSRNWAGTSGTMRRGFRDTFPFSSDNSANWIVGFWTSSTVVENENVNYQILPDSPGPFGMPRREFYLVNISSSGGVPVTEHLNLETTVRVYETKVGARSWIPLYGLGRFGITLGPLMNILNYSATTHNVYTFGTVPGPQSIAYANLNKGTLLSFGVFSGADLELTYGQFFGRLTGQYTVTEQKQIVNDDATSTNVNLSGFSTIIAGGIRW